MHYKPGNPCRPGQALSVSPQTCSLGGQSDTTRQNRNLVFGRELGTHPPPKYQASMLTTHGVNGQPELDRLMSKNRQKVLEDSV